MSAERQPEGSAYGAGAPTYDNALLQQRQLDGRLKVAISIRDAAEPGSRRHTRWSQIVNELLDRRMETMGRSG